MAVGGAGVVVWERRGQGWRKAVEGIEPVPGCGAAQAAEVAAAAFACRALAALPRRPGERVIAGNCRPAVGYLAGANALKPSGQHLALDRP
eukprot:14758594-Alexandrium_andersonii.AAC.1